MRIANSARWLLVAATALVATTHAADAADGNAAVLASNGENAPISVEAMAVNSPISFLTTKETTAPTPTKSTATPTTTAPVTAPTTAPATDGSTAGSHSNTVGSAITCAFRYSMPTASNLADELARLAASKKKTSGSSTPSPSTSSSTGSSTGSPTTGSSTGSGPGTDAPIATETPTTTTKAPKTKTPTTTTKAPTGSTDGATRYLQEAGEPTTAPTTVPASTTKKPVSTPTPTTKKPTTSPTTVPSPTTTKPSTSDSSSDSAPTPTPTATETPTSTSSGSGDSSATTPAPTVVTGEFTCDATFYGAWKTLDLTCGGEALDVAQAVAQSQCLIYSGVQNVVVDLKLCMSVCKFPKCANGTWDYAAEDGFTSDIYSKLNFAKFMASVGKDNLLDSTITTAVQSLNFKTDRECVYESEASFATCQCENLLISGKSSNSSTPSPAAYSPPVDKGLGDANHWADGLAKTTIDKVGIGAAAIGSSAAVVSVAAGAVMSVAGSVMGTGAGVASGVSAGASLGLAMAAVDLCQFSVMINQMNLDARPRLLQELGKRMAPATFSFLPFGKLDNSSSESGSGTSRRLADVDTTNSTDTSGMERYAELIGVKVDMLFYLTLAGVMILTIAPFVCCLLLVVVASPFVSEFRPFARKWFNKAVGALMMVLILSEYVVGVTATFQICYLIKHQKLSDVGLYLAIFALLFFAVGTILYGWYVVHSHEDELRDIGTKSHMEKPVYARYGPLYDEYKFESRYFFAPKLLLALFCGVTTGLIFLDGIWQVITLLVIHVAFLMFLEVKRPFPTPFMQKTASFVVIIKISALFLTLFLISSATSFHESLPTELRQGVGFAIIALQVVVLLCLMVRQMYIFYRTWKIKQQDDEQKETETMQRSFQPLGSSIDGMYPNNNNHHHRGNDDHHVAMLDEATPTLQYNHGYQHDTPKQFEASGARQPSQPKLRGLQPNPLPAHGRAMQRTRTVVQHDDPTPVHDYRRHGGHEIDL